MASAAVAQLPPSINTSQPSPIAQQQSQPCFHDYLVYLIKVMKEVYKPHEQVDKVLQYNVLNALFAKNEISEQSVFEAGICMLEQQHHMLDKERDTRNFNNINRIERLFGIREATPEEIKVELEKQAKSPNSKKFKAFALCFINPSEKNSTFEQRVTFVQDPSNGQWYFFTSTAVAKPMSKLVKEQHDKLALAITARQAQKQNGRYAKLSKSMKETFDHKLETMQAELKQLQQESFKNVEYLAPFQIVEMNYAKEYVEALRKFAIELGGAESPCVWTPEVTKAFATVASTKEHPVYRAKLESLQAKNEKPWFKPLLHMVEFDFEEQTSFLGIKAALLHATKLKAK